MTYKYITDNNLYQKQRYSYSDYGGMEFIREYLETRQDFLRQQPQSEAGDKFSVVQLPGNLIRNDLQRILGKLQAGAVDRQIMDSLNAYTKSFEVRKRIYTGYDDNWKPLENAEFEDYESYLLLANCLLYGYQYTNCLKYFSCLLKVDDTLLSVQDKLEKCSGAIFAQIIQQELAIFYRLAQENKIELEAVEWY